MDIIERLRAETRYDEPNWKACMAERDEAAAEIDRLRSALEYFVNSTLRDWSEAKEKARRALVRKVR